MVESDNETSVPQASVPPPPLVTIPVAPVQRSQIVTNLSIWIIIYGAFAILDMLAKAGFMTMPGHDISTQMGGFRTGLAWKILLDVVTAPLLLIGGIRMLAMKPSGLKMARITMIVRACLEFLIAIVALYYVGSSFSAEQAGEFFGSYFIGPLIAYGISIHYLQLWKVRKAFEY